MLEIPLRTDIPRYELVVELEGTSYRLELDYNSRTQSWVLSLYTIDGEAIVTGTRLVADWAPCRHRRDARLPPGSLVLVDTTGSGSDPTETSLGTDHRLLYFTEDEVAAA